MANVLQTEGVEVAYKTLRPLDTVYQAHNQMVAAELGDEIIQLTLRDGRRVALPLHWFPQVTGAAPDARADFRMTETEVYWPQLGTGFTLERVILGDPAFAVMPLYIQYLSDIAYFAQNHFTAVAVDDDGIHVSLADGRRVTMPLAWFPFLQTATPEQRAKVDVWEHTADWEEFDDGFSVDPVILGLP